MCATIQFLPCLRDFAEALGKRGIKAHISKGSGKGIGVVQGQVLGCNYSTVHPAPKGAGAVLFLGDGLFHALGLAFASNLPVFSCDPVQGTVRELSGEKDLFLRKRMAMIGRARHRTRFMHHIWMPIVHPSFFPKSITL